MHKNSRFFRIINSLRFRLIVLIILLAILPEMIICLGVLGSYEARAVSIRESEVISRAKILANQIAASGYFNEQNGDTSTIEAQIETLTSIYDGRVLIVNDNFVISMDTYNIYDGRTIISEEVIKAFSGNEITNYDSDNNYIEMAVPINNDDEDDKYIIGVLVVSVSTDNIALNMDYLGKIALVFAVVLSTLVLLLGIIASVHITRPLKKVSEAIDSVKEGYNSEIHINAMTETRDISERFNDMMVNMNAMDEARQEFVSNVSHELKTPLTSMKVLADSINSMGGDAPIELYQEFMGDITNEIERETKIINDLLSLVKMDKSGATVNIESVNINELLELILKRLQPIADKQHVAVVFESFRPVTAEIDEVKLTLAFTNLIENAIKYNQNEPGEGWVHVTLNADHQYFFLKVEDNGIGIPEEDLDHIYERFYRVDKSHSREIGGTGLGLAITRNSILMHRGAIKAHSILGQGTTFDVRIPLTYIQQ